MFVKEDSMLGKILAALVEMPVDYLAILLNIVEMLAGKKGGEWAEQLKRFLRQEPCWIRLLIDSAADPMCPKGWKVISHITYCEKVEWNPSKICLHSSVDNDEETGFEQFFKKLDSLPGEDFLNATVLDFLCQHKELIPEDWWDKEVYFAGTVYQNSLGEKTVRGIANGEPCSMQCAQGAEESDSPYHIAMIRKLESI